MRDIAGDAAFRAACTRFAAIPDEEWRHFSSLVQCGSFAPRQHLVREGRPALRVHFIVAGLVRLYYNCDGRELVRGFDYEDRFATAYESVLTGAAASFSIEALEPTRTLSFTGNTLQSLYGRHPCWDRFGRRVLEAEWIRQSDKARRFRTHSAEEHYRLLIARGSPIVDRVPLNQLASFLQVTPETLSRIRARMRKVDARIGARVEPLSEDA